jgi:SH3 domain
MCCSKSKAIQLLQLRATVVHSFAIKNAMASRSPARPPRRAYAMRANFDYDGEDEDLKLFDGEVIFVVAEDDSGWYTAVRTKVRAGHSSKGIFPVNYCEEVGADELFARMFEDGENDVGEDGGDDPDSLPEAAVSLEGRHVRLLCDVDSPLLAPSPLRGGTVLRIAAVVQGLRRGNGAGDPELKFGLSTDLVMWECTDDATGTEHILVAPGVCRLLPTTLIKSAGKQQ